MSNLSIYEQNMLLSFGGCEEAEAMYLRGKDSNEPASYQAALEMSCIIVPFFNVIMPILNKMYGDVLEPIKFIYERQYYRYLPRN